MSTAFDRNLLPEFESIKDDDEEILWLGRPVFIPYLFEGFGKWIFLLAFGVIWLVVHLNSKESTGAEGMNYFWLIGLLPLVQGVFLFLKKLLSFSNTAYAYSNKRVMMRTGFIGTDFKTVDYDKISDIEVNVNVVERMYEVGTIRFFSGRTQTNEDDVSKLYDKWISIENPYQIFKQVKQTSVDIKTDYNYPNALRPKSNPGYNTKYDRE